jgi:uncharacterized SAM-binding protein YcdF (DUF218 family)
VFWFWLKKVISFWLMPLPFCLALLVAGILVAHSGRRSRLGRALIAAAAALLILFSNRWVSNRILAPLEARFPPIPELSPGAPVPGALARCRFVVVLGGGHSDIPWMPALSQLSTSALGRVAEAVRLVRVLPEARLIVSGPGEPGRPSHAAVLAQAAASLGVDPARITLIDTAQDTEDEAAAVARIAGGAPVALVTSAWHMPRAALLFRRRGTDFLACPADFEARAGPRVNLGDLGWDSESLERSTLAVHEWLGLLWLRLRG